MRYLSPVLGLGVLLLVSGCADSKWSLFRNSPANVRLPPDRQPTATDLVTMQNTNARRIQSLVCDPLELDITQGLQQFHISGKLACQRPRYFRMQADVVGRTEADIGSNNEEFWYWIKRGDPYLVHCSYQDLTNGVRIPFPFQPDWVMEALGISEYESDAAAYTLLPNGRTFQLVQNTRNLQGQPVRKVTEFNPSTLHVTGHIIQDERGKEICRAQIREHQEIAGVILPRRISFSYPAEKLKIEMVLGHRTSDVNIYQQLDPQSVLFRRPTLNGVQNFDLARGLEAANQLTPAGGLQR
jgi:hypothetical protein